MLSFAPWGGAINISAGQIVFDADQTVLLSSTSAKVGPFWDTSTSWRSVLPSGFGRNEEELLVDLLSMRVLKIQLAGIEYWRFSMRAPARAAMY